MFLIILELELSDLENWLILVINSADVLHWIYNVVQKHLL